MLYNVYINILNHVFEKKMTLKSTNINCWKICLLFWYRLSGLALFITQIIDIKMLLIGNFNFDMLKQNYNIDSRFFIHYSLLISEKLINYWYRKSFYLNAFQIDKIEGKSEIINILLIISLIWFELSFLMEISCKKIIWETKLCFCHKY